MELSTNHQCACAGCDNVINYRSSQAGEIVECPKCHEKSRLPEPEKLTIVQMLGPDTPDSRTCAECGNQIQFLADKCPLCEAKRKRKTQLAYLAVSTLAIALIVVLAVVRPFRKNPMAAASGDSGARNSSTTAVPHSIIMMEQPHPRMPKSSNDLHAIRFSLQKSSGSDLSIAVGDIENDSENVHTDLRADLDVLDRNGQKIGTASDYFTELGPHQTWHFLVTVPQTNAINVKFRRITEK